MSVRGLTRRGRDRGHHASTCAQGEILGLAGLMGAGRTEVLEAIFGVTKVDAGEILINGKQVRIRVAARRDRGRDRPAHRGPQADRDHGRALGARQHDDRQPRALQPQGASSASAGWSRRARRSGRRSSIKTPTLSQLIRHLSGGNQQKVLVSRWLLTLPDILMIDEPTRGIDVGAKSEIHRLMSGAREGGQGDPDGLVGDARDPGHERPRPGDGGGRITGEFSRAEVTQEKVLRSGDGSSRRRPEAGATDDRSRRRPPTGSSPGSAWARSCAST